MRELVAPKPLLEQLVQDHAKQLIGATLVMLEGVHIRPGIVEDDGTPRPHRVEYLQVGGTSLPIDHIDVSTRKPAAAE